MKTITIHQRPEFLKKMPKKLQIPAEGKKVIVTDSLSNSTIELEENSNLTFVTLLREGWKEHKKITFHLKGENSQVNFLSLIIAKDKEKFPFETISHHSVPHTNAYYYIRGAMFDQSQVDYKGNLAISKAAQQTDSYLAHHSLMLSKDAKVNTIPCLEIEADDVKAGHAATLGKIDDEQLFYLQSRGLGKKAAQNLLIKSFFKKDLNILKDEDLRCLICEEIDKEIDFEGWETYGDKCLQHA